MTPDRQDRSHPLNRPAKCFPLYNWISWRLFRLCLINFQFCWSPQYKGNVCSWLGTIIGAYFKLSGFSYVFCITQNLSVVNGIKLHLNCARKYTAIKIINIALQKSLKPVWSQVASAHGPRLFCLLAIHPKHRQEEQAGKHRTAAAGLSPLWEEQMGHHSSLHKLWCTAGWVCRAPGCRWNLWSISAVFRPAWGWLLRKIPVPGPAHHPIGVLSKVMAAHKALVFCRAPWCGLQGEQERTQGCEIQAGICLSQLPRERQRWLFHYSPKAVTNSESKLHLVSKIHGCLGLRNHMLAGAKEESELSPAVGWKGSFSVLKGPVPQTESLLHLSYTSVASPCQSLVGSSSPR